MEKCGGYGCLGWIEEATDSFYYFMLGIMVKVRICWVVYIWGEGEGGQLLTMLGERCGWSFGVVTHPPIWNYRFAYYFDYNQHAADTNNQFFKLKIVYYK